MYKISGEKVKYRFDMYDNFNENDISEVEDVNILYRKKYIFLGKLVPYIQGFSSLKKTEPFVITTTNITIIE